jgi:hypothetical protein
VCGLVVILPQVNILLMSYYEISLKGCFDPLISIPGVKMSVNTVNIQEITPLFPLQA